MLALGGSSGCDDAQHCIAEMLMCTMQDCVQAWLGMLLHLRFSVVICLMPLQTHQEPCFTSQSWIRCSKCDSECLQTPGA